MMLPLLMAYSIVTGLVLVAAAHASEAMLHLLRLPRRWAWVCALAALVVLTSIALLRSASPAPAVRALDASAVPISSAPARSDGTGESLRNAFERIVNVPLHALAGLYASYATTGASSSQAPSASSRIDTAAAVIWSSGSGALLAGLLTAAARARVRRRSWPVVAVAGARVRLSRDIGPAVLGMVHPEIVLPAWLLDRPECEQRIIVAHERSHLMARDPLLLLFGCIAVALLPWNVCAWWMMRRLRLALEIDCDARVLRGVTTPAPYGRLLIAMAERRSTLRMLSAALADSTTDLERRLTAMNARPGSYRAARAATTAVAAALLMLVACEADLPSSAELDAMSATEIVEAATPFAALEDAVYIIDGVEADAATANLLAPDEIATIDIRKGAATPDGASAVVEITTRGALAAAGAHIAARVSGDLRLGDDADSFDGLLLIDGKRADLGVLRTIDPGTIESVEVVKGAAATRRFSEPEARRGVISIRLKPTPSR